MKAFTAAHITIAATAKIINRTPAASPTGSFRCANLTALDPPDIWRLAHRSSPDSLPSGRAGRRYSDTVDPWQARTELLTPSQQTATLRSACSLVPTPVAATGGLTAVSVAVCGCATQVDPGAPQEL